MKFVFSLARMLLRCIVNVEMYTYLLLRVLHAVSMHAYRTCNLIGLKNVLGFLFYSMCFDRIARTPTTGHRHLLLIIRDYCETATNFTLLPYVTTYVTAAIRSKRVARSKRRRVYSSSTQSDVAI